MTAGIHNFTARRADTAATLVVLSLDGIALALPQHEIAALEPILDVQSLANRKAKAAGSLTIGERPCPVYALGSELNCLPKIPQSYRVCAILNNDSSRGREAFALACIEIRFVPRAAVATHELPRAMVKQKTPIKSLLVHGEQLLFATNVNALFTHITRIDADIIPFDERSRKLRQ